MEFFKEVRSPDVSIEHLKKLLTINNLTEMCASISNVTAKNECEGEIYCTWGSFNVRRDEIRYGIRFSLLNCPHALAWTITLDEEKQDVVIHCTIDKKEQDPDFVASIYKFVEDWSKGIADALHNNSG